jgi:hypothetical protein
MTITSPIADSRRAGHLDVPSSAHHSIKVLSTAFLHLISD